ncbi:hypothetical protein [Hydrogenophaga sp. BPS33]|uniref:hypothetical protein n=1 Tax=Hydrogenophaga sp. BPS33 TaxID=2651974 RepID=UPI001F3CFB1F|nr:hypothetical protein [Hydrogenophaga sp. BPS33]
MRLQWGVGKVIGVDLSFEAPTRIDLEQLPGPWALLRDRLRPSRLRRYRLPSLMTAAVGPVREHGAEGV